VINRGSTCAERRYSPTRRPSNLNVAACAGECDWAFEHPVAAESNHLRAAVQFLARRTSLGWTNLDRAFEVGPAERGAAGQELHRTAEHTSEPHAQPNPVCRRPLS